MDGPLIHAQNTQSSTISQSLLSSAAVWSYFLSVLLNVLLSFASSNRRSIWMVVRGQYFFIHRIVILLIWQTSFVSETSFIPFFRLLRLCRFCSLSRVSNDVFALTVHQVMRPYIIASSDGVLTLLSPWCSDVAVALTFRRCCCLDVQTFCCLDIQTLLSVSRFNVLFILAVWTFLFYMRRITGTVYINCSPLSSC